MKILFYSLLILISNFKVEPAPNFSYTSIDGSTQDLSELKGEVIYLSFWASWCGVCKKNFEKYADIRSELQNEGVILLNVNLDDTKEKWTKALDKNNILGTNVQATDLLEIKQLFEITTLPNYQIIDRNGNFAYISRTPGTTIVDEFKKWLSEKSDH